MSFIEFLASAEHHTRPLLSVLPNHLAVRLASMGRLLFQEKLANSLPRKIVTPSPDSGRDLWGLRFRAPLMNSAGMFKYGEGYELAFRQGAGGYIVGTTTALPRLGNERSGIRLPFAPYPKSNSASNWLGLPNLGHTSTAKLMKGVLRENGKRPGFPVGVSVSSDPLQSGDEALSDLVIGMRSYESAGVDFIELNESCPNTESTTTSPHSNSAIDPELLRRLEIIANEFVSKSSVPVVVKFSCDTDLVLVEELVRRVVTLGFGGINFGNTSTFYSVIANQLDTNERALLQYFSDTFGGGVSGRILKSSSLELAMLAVESLNKLQSQKEFHIIRTGGIESSEDVSLSIESGVSLCQWYTGYYSAFAQHGHEIYQAMHTNLR